MNQRRFLGVYNAEGYRYECEVQAPTLTQAYELVCRREGINRSQLLYVKEL